MSLKRVRPKPHRDRTGRDADEPATDNDGVGYGKPPRANRFKPGQSGNPKGRPKGAKNELTILREVMNRKIAIREGATVKKVSVLEGIHLQMAQDSLKGNTKSAAFLLNRYGALVSGEAPQSSISEDDEQILDAYTHKIRNEKKR